MFSPILQWVAGHRGHFLLWQEQVDQWEDGIRYEVSLSVCWETRKWPLRPLFNVLGMEEKTMLGLAR